jgi:hypothetical protein
LTLLSKRKRLLSSIKVFGGVHPLAADIQETLPRVPYVTKARGQIFVLVLCVVLCRY